ncbi:peptidoglycan-binding domain-containing protein [Jannaschia aquimarina]|uniref:Putative peptidoglycan binding domain protein n=1 Tax=Jannaschia aquimarina TaxID=935700 RepID=A0A0D1EQG2_9RHOB|nr:peptidoglycan-binding domain-containing protein [Jannaschia aquimarina]KIT17830.1 putative peptidoglycan binding domain protein [Jannaschia aquimarina]SNS90538.1 Putative peptidoglycan binding domain-containing protein [Jannaschia aquimarina]
MFRNRLLATVAAFAVAMPVTTMTTTPARAGADDVAAGLIGGIIGGAIVNHERNKRRTTTRRSTTNRSTRTRSSRPAMTAAQRQENRDVQTALNYFGFNAGGADGVLGQRSRSAISGMQAFLALPSDGTLTEFERSVLLSAHSRALSGAPDVAKLISTSQIGQRAVLKDQYARMSGGVTVASTSNYPGLPAEVSRAVDEIAASSDPSAEQLLQRAGFIQLADMNGDGRNDYIIDTALSGSSYWCGANDCQVLVFASTADGYARNNLLTYSPTPASFECVGATCRLSDAPPQTREAVAPAPVVPAPTAPNAAGTVAAALPTFGAPAPAAPVQASLAGHCEKVTLLTTTRGGPVTQSGGDRSVALAEQFCLARAHSILSTQERLDALGVAPEQAAAQCEAFKPVMAQPVAALASGTMDDVMSGVTQVVLGAGLTPDQLRDTATVCLGAGYRADDTEIALGAALLLVALGSDAHAELLGHHVAQGFGADADRARAAAWYGRAIDALKGGATPVFAPGQTDRAALLTWASGAADGAAAASPATPVPASVALPTFGAPAD